MENEKMVCNKCAKQIGFENKIVINHCFGYGSKRDMSLINNLCLCEKCLDEVVDLILPTLKISPIAEWDGEYYKAS